MAKSAYIPGNRICHADYYREGKITNCFNECGRLILQVCWDDGAKETIPNTRVIDLSTTERVLKNGATLLTQRDIRDGKIILADCGEDSVQRYATWWMSKDGATSNGHYSDTLREALSDYQTRK